MIVDCNSSENLISDRGSLRHSVDVEPNAVRVRITEILDPSCLTAVTSSK